MCKSALGAALIWLIGLPALSFAALPTRDCFVGSPPQCNNSLASDSTCRGIEVSTIDGWKRMDCDYAIYNIPSETRPSTKKWLVVHAGGCDTYTEDLGDYFAVDMELNQFGLRPCGGFDDSLCAAQHGYDTCAALHISWLFPALNRTGFAPHGLGLNPPALVDIYHTPNTTMLFLHEYGDTNKSYNWYPADGCNASSTPIYMCVGALDSNRDTKYAAIKSTLEAVSNTTEFPCRLELIDATLLSSPLDPTIPCSGILREYNNPMLVGGDTSGAPNWAWEMTAFMTRAVQLATQVNPQGPLVNAFRQAIDIALCNRFEGSKCMDADSL